jgi:hypothetical protein
VFRVVKDLLIGWSQVDGGGQRLTGAELEVAVTARSSPDVASLCRADGRSPQELLKCRGTGVRDKRSMRRPPNLVPREGR